MTCIVGLVHGDTVIIGADSAGVHSATWQITVRRDRKVFRNGDFLIGFTSSFRMGQLLAFNFTPPKPRADVDVMTYMVTDFIDAVRTCLKTGGYARVKESADEGGEFLVGYRGRLFNIHEDFQVAESTLGYAACGCGGQPAIGSLYSTRTWSDPAARVTEALTCAEAFSAGVRGPFHIEVL